MNRHDRHDRHTIPERVDLGRRMHQSTSGLAFPTKTPDSETRDVPIKEFLQHALRQIISRRQQYTSVLRGQSVESSSSRNGALSGRGCSSVFDGRPQPPAKYPAPDHTPQVPEQQHPSPSRARPRICCKLFCLDRSLSGPLMPLIVLWSSRWMARDPLARLEAFPRSSRLYVL
jgi:hypothetical protein